MADEEKKGPESDVHPQPLAGARPSIEPAPEFNDDVANAAAKKLREAMKGFGTNERKIIEVTNGFSHEQRLRIKNLFTTMFKRDLMKDLKSELTGNFEKLCLPFWYERGEYDAEQIYKAVEGLGFSTDKINEIICTRTNEELAAMQAAWTHGKSLIERIKSETKKTFGSGNYTSLLATILEGKRPGNAGVDKKKALQDAETLNRVLNQEKESDAKAKFVEILTTRSWVEIREISAIFQDVSKKYTLKGAIKKAFGDGDTGKALQTIDEFVTQPYDFWAQKLKKAMKGMGTDDDLLRRVIISRAEVDLRDVGIVFGQRYGDGKTLQKWLKDDLGGDYEKLCLAVCGLDTD